jgi:hypothetical protein
MVGIMASTLSAVQSGPPHIASHAHVPLMHMPRPEHCPGHHSREQSSPAFRAWQMLPATTSTRLMRCESSSLELSVIL